MILVILQGLYSLFTFPHTLFHTVGLYPVVRLGSNHVDDFSSRSVELFVSLRSADIKVLTLLKVSCTGSCLMPFLAFSAARSAAPTHDAQNGENERESQ